MAILLRTLLRFMANPLGGDKKGAPTGGALTLHGTTKTIQITLQAQRQGGIIAIAGSVPIVFADFGFQGPNSFSVVSVDDHGIMELHLLFTHA